MLWICSEAILSRAVHAGMRTCCRVLRHFRDERAAFASDPRSPLLFVALPARGIFAGLIGLVFGVGLIPLRLAARASCARGCIFRAFGDVLDADSGALATCAGGCIFRGFGYVIEASVARCASNIARLSRPVLLALNVTARFV